MRKLLLLVAFAALSSAVFGQMTQVFSAKEISMSGFEPIYGGRYVIAYTGSSAYLYDPTDFHLVYTLSCPSTGPYPYLNVFILPRGLYGDSSDDYAVLFYGYGSVDDENPDHSEVRIYKLNPTPVLVETLLSSNTYKYYPRWDGSDLSCLYRFNNSAFLFVYSCNKDAETNPFIDYLFKFPNSISPSSVSETKADNSGMMAYPNPSRDKINLVYQAPDKATSVKVYDVNGRQVARIPVGSTSTECTLDVSNYPEGVYFYEINGNSQSFMVK